MTAPHPVLPAAVLALLALAVLLRSRRIGRGVYTFEASGSAHDLQGMVFRLVAVALAGFVLARTAYPGLDMLAGQIGWLSAAPVAWAGLVLMALGGALVGLAQWQMGRSWRIGLGREATDLVTGGLFAYSRNPVFLGFLLMLVGAFLLSPNALTATALGVGCAAMATQIRLEEAHLEALHGDAYRHYRARVRRWL